MKRFFPFLLAFFLLLPLVASAQFGPIVPEACHNCPCGFGGVMAIIQNLVNFIIGIAIIFGTIILVWGGILYIISPANPESRSTANKMLINAVVGLCIVLSAWLVVDFVMKALYSGPDGQQGKFGPWNSILLGGEGAMCVESRGETPPLFDGNITAVPGNTGNTNGGVTTNGGCTGDGSNAACAALAPDVQCAAQGCKVDSGLRAALAGIQSSVGWTVTEGYPPSRTHAAACHSNGTCVDVGLRPRTYTIETVTAFATAARAQGLRVVFETDSCTLRDAVRASGIAAYCRSDGGGYERITGNHFSVYAR